MQLRISSLCKTYPNGVKALKNVSLTIGSGLFGLLGPNGAGKSSLMRILSSSQEPDEGTVFLDDLDLLKEKTKLRQLLGYLPQEFGVYPRISAEHLLDHIAQLKGIDNKMQRRELVEYYLQKVNLWNVRKKIIGTYSGGMKQRFGVAQALIGNPRIIIVDEPTAGLDPGERNRFYNLLSQIGENAIVILSTHIVEDISTLCHSFAILCRGEILFNGEPETAIASMEGYLYSKAISMAELPKYKEHYHVISTQIKSGKLFIRVFSETVLQNGFTATQATLEDLYFRQVASKIDTSFF